MQRHDKTTQMLGQTIGPVVNEPSPLSGEPISSKLPCYRLDELLGRQTGRRTFLAYDTCAQRQVVVKLLLFGPDFTWEDLKLFEREAETLKSLDHPAIPKYLDSFEVETALGSGFVLIQTYIEAQSLQSLVMAGRRFSETDLKTIAQSLLKILQYLHGQYPTVVHRDLKPSNILLSEHASPMVSNNTSQNDPLGTVYLVDFGSVQTAQHSGTMTVVGTYGYMPPEQFGGRAQPASDLYSLGATLIYLATGQHPADLTRDDLQIEFAAHTNLSPTFVHWIKKLTYADLAQRTPSAVQALQQLNRPQPAPVPRLPATSTYTSRPTASLNASVSKMTPRQTSVPLTPTFNGFEVSSTPDELEIDLPAARATGSLTMMTKRDRQPIALVIFLVILLIGLAPLVLLLSNLWVLLAAVVIIYYITSLNKKPRRITQSISPKNIKLFSPASGPLILSLMTSTQLTLKEISTYSQPFSSDDRIDFHFHDG